MPPRKKTATTAASKNGSAPTTVSPLAKTDTPKAEAKTADGDGIEKVGVDVPADGNVHEIEITSAKATAPKASKPSAASLARRKRELIDELRSEHTAVARATEIHKILRTEFAGVPILSHQELSRLGD